MFKYMRGDNGVETLRLEHPHIVHAADDIRVKLAIDVERCDLKSLPAKDRSLNPLAWAHHEQTLPSA